MSVGTVLFQSSDPPLTVHALLGDGPVLASDGYGGWTTVGRPRRPALTEWAGREPLRLTIPILIDGFSTGNGLEVERNIKHLEMMAGQYPGAGEPPLIRVFGTGIPHGYERDPHTEWVIESLEWGDSLTDLNGDRIRQAGTVKVMQYIVDEVLENISHVKKRRQQRGTKNKGKQKSSPVKRYQVRKGDTLSGIAARFLGNGNRWREIARLNGIRDPRNLRVGQVLRLP